jgi:hypothetical protein
MKTIVQALWSLVPNKAVLIYNFAMFCVFTAVIGGSATWFAFNVPVWDGEVATKAFHNHAKRHQVFDAATNDKQNEILALIDEKSATSMELMKIKREYREHERDLYNLVDDDGNFLSDFKKKRWERRDEEIKKDLKDIEDMMKGHNSLFQSGMMFATRDR